MKVWLIDLDDTLIDTSGILIPEAARGACQIILNECHLPTTMEELLKLRSQWGVHMSHRYIFKKLIERFAPNLDKIFLQEISDKASNYFYNPPIPDTLDLRASAREVLEKNYRTKELYLITAGIEQAQKNKIKHLNILKYFQGVYIVNTRNNENKFKYFKNILKYSNKNANDFLSIGNRLSQEIRESKMLHMKTCYMAHGEHVGEQINNQFEIADYTISNWNEFQKLQDEYGI